jgi:hypothetical protein
VQPSGDLVAVIVEHAAGVQHREDDLGGRLAALVTIHGNAAAVVDDRDRVVDVNGDVDLIAVTGQRLVNRVVDDLVDEMMQSGGAGRPGMAVACTARAPENLDLVGAVVVDGGSVPIRAWDAGASGARSARSGWSAGRK